MRSQKERPDWYDVRLEALEYAVRSSPNGNAKGIVEAATLFEAYIVGKAETAEPKGPRDLRWGE